MMPSSGPTHGLHRLVVLCSLRHSKCTWLFRTIRISLHRQNLADLRLGRPCSTSTLFRMPEGSSSLSRWGLVRRLLTFLLYPCRCRHHRHGRSCSPTQPPLKVSLDSMSAKLCPTRWMRTWVWRFGLRWMKGILRLAQYHHYIHSFRRVGR